MGVAAVGMIPSSLLDNTWVDELILGLSEALLDANDFGVHAARGYLRRIPDLAARDYFLNRYRGYLSGMGFLYSLMMEIPLLGIPLSLIGQVGTCFRLPA